MASDGERNEFHTHHCTDSVVFYNIGLLCMSTSPQTIESYTLSFKLHVYKVFQYAEDTSTGVSSQHQVSGRGPTFKMTRGSFFATAAAEGAISEVDSGDEAGEASAAASPTG